MNWYQHMDSHYHYVGSNAPYNSAGSFMDFFAGLTYDHVNFIFSGSQIQVQIHNICLVFVYSFRCEFTHLVILVSLPVSFRLWV